MPKIIPSHLNIKLGSLFSITIFFIVVFALIYWKFFNRSFNTAMFNAVLIQTLNGKGTGNGSSDNDEPLTNREKTVIALQSIFAYLITSGIIIVSLV